MDIKLQFSSRSQYYGRWLCTDAEIKLKQNNSDGSVSNLNSYVQNRSPSYTHFDKPKSGSWEKNKNSYIPSEINKGELPKSITSCFYCKKKGHIVSECWVLKRKNENKPQGSIACNA
jgi:hypothetical protein